MKLYFNDIYYCHSYCTDITIVSLLQGAFVKFDKTVFLRKICYRNGLVMCIVVHKMRCQKINIDC